MKRTRISARARKHFLQLAAVAFATGSGSLAASTPKAASADQRSAAVGAQSGDEHYHHEFTLARDDAGEPLGARIDVIPLANADAFSLAAAGPCCIGPLQPGPHALKITQGQRIENHLIRIDRGTGAFLHFVG